MLDRQVPWIHEVGTKLSLPEAHIATTKFPFHRYIDLERAFLNPSASLMPDATAIKTPLQCAFIAADYRRWSGKSCRWSENSIFYDKKSDQGHERKAPRCYGSRGRESAKPTSGNILS